MHELRCDERVLVTRWTSDQPGALNVTIPQSRHVATVRAVTALGHAQGTANRFLKAFDDAQARRGGGTPSNVEQDFLRSMLVFACAGLDAAVGHLVRDSAESMLTRSAKLREAVENYAAEQLGVPKAAATFALDLWRMGSPTLDKTLVERFITKETAGSLQAPAVLLRLCDYFELVDQASLQQVLALRAVFAARNLIVHEMDIDFNGVNRKRTSRRRAEMVDAAEKALSVTADDIRRMQDKLLA